VNNFLKMSDGANVMPLLLAIHRLEKSHGAWKEDTYLRDYPQGPFGDTDSIILRFPTRSNQETKDAIIGKIEGFDQHENHDQPVFKLLPEARQLIFTLMAFVNGERLGRCIINKIKSGGVIYPHCDGEEHANYWDRFHIVLSSSAGCNFRCGDEIVHMNQGEVWWFNNKVEHEVINNSADDRIHLVIDIRTSKP